MITRRTGTGRIHLSVIVAGTALALLAIGGCTRTVYVYQDANGQRIESNDPPRQNAAVDITDLHPADDGADAFAGRWSADRAALVRSQPMTVRLATRGETPAVAGNTTTPFLPPEAMKSSAGLQSATAPGAFELKRDAGVLSLDGFDDAATSSGVATLRFDAAYTATMTEITGTAPTPAEKMSLFAYDLKLADARAIRDAGYKTTLDGLLTLRRNGIGTQYALAVRKAGYRFELPQIVSLSRNGIATSYMTSLREGGFDLTEEQIIKLSRNGISSSYAIGLRASGYGKVDEIIDLSRNGVSSSFAAAAGEGGKRSARDLIELSRNGISSDYVSRMREAGVDATVPNLVALSRNGISSDYARKLHDVGYAASVADLIEFNRNGVSTDFIASLHLKDKPDLPAATIIDLARRGVSAETAKMLRGS